MKLRCLCLIILWIAWSLPAKAQTYTAQKVQFSQLGTFTQQQLEDVAGVHSGTTLTATDLGAAAQRLVDTGYFDDVGATIEGKISAATIKFDTKPTDLAHLLPVGYANFVWLTHEELEAAIRAKIPLYNDYLPENSPREEEIKAVLTAALAAKAVNAVVAFDTFEPTLRHPRRQIAFRVVQPDVRVSNVKLGGVTPALVPLVQISVNGTARTAYEEGPANRTSEDRILEPLLNAGYEQAKLIDRVPTPGPADNGVVPVVLSARLQPGEVYQVASVTFAGTPMLSAEAFAATAKLHAGEVASREKLLETLVPLDAAYRRKGYMDVVVDTAPSLDAVAHTVAYTVSVSPGEQYRVHEVTASGLDAAAKADFDRGWLMKEGELYDPEYAKSFLKQNTALRALEGYSAGFKAYADPNTHTVDLIITFARMGPKSR